MTNHTETTETTTDTQPTNWLTLPVAAGLAFAIIATGVGLLMIAYSSFM